MTLRNGLHRRFALIALGVVCLALVAVAPAANAAAGSDDGPSWLWVHQAEHGTFMHDAHGWKLTLTGAQDDLAALSDGPRRATRVEPLSGFLAEWDLRFGASRPNAAIVVPSAGGHGDVLSVSLNKPVVQSRDGHKIVYRARVAPTGTRHVDTRLPRTFSDPVLFIDSGPEHEDTTIYKALVNYHEQYSIWPADREPPLGWYEAGFSGTRAEVLRWIEEVWQDMRPKSLRERMGG